MPGGNGGNTSSIVFQDFNGNVIQTPIPSNNEFTPSTRPLQATGPTGLIAIYGNPGKRGVGGIGGNGGERGHGCNLGKFCTGKSNDGVDGADRKGEKQHDGNDGRVKL